MNAEHYIAENFAESRRRIRVVGEELPRGRAQRFYVASASAATWTEDITSKPAAEGNRPDVWLALFALIVGVATLPLDYTVGSVVGIPAFMYLLAASKGK